MTPPTPPAPGAAGSRRGVQLIVGVVILLAGLLGAAALWFAAEARYDDNLATFARAPSGCSTTLDFERTGDFTLYVETTGRIDDIDGDCAAEASWDREDVPEVEVTLTGVDGAVVEIERGGGAGYDNGTFAGEAIGVVRIDEPGEHTLTVPASGAGFAVAVGGPPEEGVGLLRWGAVALAVVAVLAGGALVVLGARRPPPGPVAVSTALGAPGWPTGPPGFPTPPPTTGAVGPPAASTAPIGPLGPAGPPGRDPPPWGPPPSQ